jgi:hypothetical protein
VIPVQNSRSMIRAVRAAGGNPIYTEYTMATPVGIQLMVSRTYCSGCFLSPTDGMTKRCAVSCRSNTSWSTCRVMQSETNRRNCVGSRTPTSPSPPGMG